MNTNQERTIFYLTKAGNLNIYIRQSIAQALQYERHKRNLSIEAVAEKTALLPKKIHKIEKGEGKINFYILAILLSFYNKRLYITADNDTENTFIPPIRD